MQSYRLMIGPGGNVLIPDGQPGRMVTVLLDDASPTFPALAPKPIFPSFDFLGRAAVARTPRRNN